MKEVPVSFEFKGKNYAGHLSLVNGGGPNNVWHLMIDKCYWGQLFYSIDQWRFYSNHEPDLYALSEYFGWIVTAWNDVSPE